MSDVQGTTGGTSVPATPTQSAIPASSKGTPAPAGQVKSESIPTNPAPKKPYFRYKWDDGKEDIYNDENELAAKYRAGVLRHDRFTQLTQEHAKKVEAFEAEKKQHQETIAQIQGLKSKYDSIDEFMRKRPDVYERLTKEMKAPSTQAAYSNAQKYVDEQTKAIRDELAAIKKEREDEKAARDNEQKRRQTIDAMKSRYPDFDEDTANAYVTSLYEGAPGDEMAQLMETIYWANKGKAGGAKIAEKITEDLKRKNAVKPTLTDSPSTGARPVFSKIKEAAEAAKRGIRE